MAKPKTPARPPIHCVVYGPPGSGKSTFAATFPKPMLVFAFDPLGKEAPYLKCGVVGEPSEGDQGQPVTTVTSPKGALRIQVEYYHDVEVEADGRYRPVAYRQFLQRFVSLYDEVRSGQWRTIVVDTLTYMELAARKLSQYDLDKTSREPRRWFAAATDMLEEAIMCRLGGLRTNVVILAHIDSERDEVAGAMVYNPAAPGRMRLRIGGGYPELYVAHVRRTEKGGDLEYFLQTRANARYNAASVYLEAPDPCVPHYAALWETFDARADAANGARKEERQDEPQPAE